MARLIVPVLNLGLGGRLTKPVVLPDGTPSDDPLVAAVSYNDAGADELFVRADLPSHTSLIGAIERLSRSISIPLTLQAEFETAEAFGRLLGAGATRVATASAALRNPDLIAALARQHGSESVIVWISTARLADYCRVVAPDSGSASEWEAVTWARVTEAQGAGAVVVSSLGRPHGEPFDLDLLAEVGSALAIPVLAEGEAEGVEDILDALMIGDTDGVLIGSLLHSGRRSVAEVKAYLAEHGLSS